LTNREHRHLDGQQTTPERLWSALTEPAFTEG
jgi:hypothetical protein